MEVFQDGPLPVSLAMVHRNGKRKYTVGKRYAIQVGRGNASIGTFTLRGLVLDRLGHIDRDAALAEGVQPVVYKPGDPLYRFATADNRVFRGDDPVKVYLAAWGSLYRDATDDDPVYVLLWDPQTVETAMSYREQVEAKDQGEPHG